MWFVYTTPLWIIGLLVFLPSLLEVRMERWEGTQGRIVFALGMGLIGIALHLGGEGLQVGILLLKRSLIRIRPKRKEKEKPEGRKRPEPVSRKPAEAVEEKEGKRRLYENIREKVQTARTLFDRYREPGLRCLRSIFRALRIQDAAIYLEIGLEDPAHTGFLAGWVHALSYLTDRHLCLDLTPNFTERCLRGTARLRLHIALYRILWAILRLAVDIAPGLIRSYVLPRLRWPKRTPLVVGTS